jgi:hypothetical protein
MKYQWQLMQMYGSTLVMLQTHSVELKLGTEQNKTRSCRVQQNKVLSP